MRSVDSLTVCGREESHEGLQGSNDPGSVVHRAALLGARSERTENSRRAGNLFSKLETQWLSAEQDKDPRL